MKRLFWFNYVEASKNFLLQSMVALIFILACFSGCTGVPDRVTAISNFDVNRYMGTWYEIARFDHSFERGLSKVSAVYSIREDGGIDVINRGFDNSGKIWKEARGRGYFVNNIREGRLKVSFFGPFYGAYNIVALDLKNYSYAMICSYNYSYLWILARGKSLDRKVLNELISQAESAGFKTDRLIWVDQSD